jgi:hypothetical protein
MKNLASLILTVLFQIAVAIGAHAQTIPDLKGTWVVEGLTAISDGPTNHSGDASPGPATSGKFNLFELKFTYQVDGQDGLRFWGTSSSERDSERLLGSLSAGGKRVAMITDDGYADGELVDNDTIDFCYRHITEKHSVVACGLLKRQK